MDFANVSFDTGQAPPVSKRGGGGKPPIDFNPLFEAARSAGGDWVSFEGGSALNNYRTHITQGKPEGCEVGDFDVKVTEEVAPDPENEVPGQYRLYIREADAERRAQLLANEERRLARAAARAAARGEGASNDDDDDDDDDDEGSPLD